MIGKLGEGWLLLVVRPKLLASAGGVELTSQVGDQGFIPGTTRFTPAMPGVTLKQLPRRNGSWALHPSPEACEATALGVRALSISLFLKCEFAFTRSQSWFK